MEPSYEAKVEAGTNQDLVLRLPIHLLQKMGWKTGDEIEWVARDDGTFLLRKPGELDDSTHG